MADAPERDRRPLLAGAASALVVLVFFGWFVTFGPGHWRGSEPSAMEAMASQTAGKASLSPTTLSTFPPVAGSVTAVASGSLNLTDAEALAQLEARSSGGSTLKVQGQWVAQLASKYVGIVDAQQTSASGSHKFGAVDILAEHLALETGASGARVVLLNSTTYGTGKNNAGSPYWVTVATDPSFTSAEVIISWCQAQFPQLTGTALNNRCLATQLMPLA